MTVHVRPARPDDAAPWSRMRRALWPEGTEGEHAAEIALFFAGRAAEPLAVLVAEADGERVGFVELSIRSHAAGCEVGRVAYVEGWFVRPETRGVGVGRALIAAAEDWGRGQGCRELGSDAEVDDAGSAAAHLALGFGEVEVVRCFRKALESPHAGE